MQTLSRFLILSLLLLLIVFIFSGFQQNTKKPNSNASNQDIEKVNTLFQKANNYRNSSFDTAMIYHQKAHLAFQQLKQSDKLELSDTYISNVISWTDACLYVKDFKQVQSILDTVLFNDATMLSNAHKIRLWLQKGKAYLSNPNEREKATPWINRSLKFIERDTFASQDELNIALGWYYLHNNQLKTAKDFYQKVLDNKKASDISYFKAISGLGELYYKSNKLDSALLYYQRTLDAKQQDAIQSLPNHFNISYTFYYSGQRENFKKQALTAHDLYKRTFKHDTPPLANIYNLVGAALMETGEYYKAIDYFEQAIRVYKQFAILNSIPSVIYNRAICYKSIGENKQAIKAFQQSILEGEKLKNPSLILSAHHELGEIYRIKKNYQLSEFHNQQSLALKIKELGPEHLWSAASYFRLGQLYIDWKKYEKALLFFKKCLAIYQKLDKKEGADVSNIYYQFGLAHHGLGQYPTAINYFQKSIKALVPAFDETNIYAQPPLDSAIFSNMQLVYPLVGRAKSFHEQFRQSNTPKDGLAATEGYDCGNNLLEKMRRSLKREDSRQHIMELARMCYDGAMEHTIYSYNNSGEQKHLEQAFTIIENAKATLLREAMLDSDAKYETIDADLLEQEHQLNHIIGEKESLLNQALLNDDQQLATTLRDSLFDLRQRQEQLILKFEQEYPEYYESKYKTEWTDIATVQERLKADKATLLNYYIADSVLYCLAVNSNEVAQHQVAIDSQFFHKVDTFLAFLQNPVIPVDSFKTLSEYFYETLLAPPLEKLTTKQLIIIPDGVLGYIPFETLVANADEGGSYRTLDYLFKHYDLRYEYSATLAMTTRKKNPTSETYLGIAPGFLNQPQKKENAGLIAGLGDVLTRGGNINPIPKTLEEVKDIHNILGGQALLEEAAQKSAFIEQAPDYKILHLATHAFADDEKPLYNSGFIFSKNPQNDTTDYEYLRGHELYNMRLNADLAVLSACETNIGKHQRGEGIISLSRAFKYAGCANIITSLWKVPDASTKDIVTRFFNELVQEKGKAEALRQARLDFLDNASGRRVHPFFWSALVLIGDNEPVLLPTSYSRWWMGIGLVGLLLLGFVFIKKSGLY